jgi:hypothetical protein
VLEGNKAGTCASRSSVTSMRINGVTLESRDVKVTAEMREWVADETEKQWVVVVVLAPGL